MKRHRIALITALVALMCPFLGYSAASLASEELNAQILDSFAVPGSSPTGLAWDGSSLWMVDNLDNLYQLDTSGNVLQSCPLGFAVSDLAWDGQHLWALKDSFTGLVSLDTGANCGQVIQTLQVGYWPGSGVALAGSYFWVGDYNSGVIHKHDQLGNQVLYFSTGFFGHPTGISFDGTDLLIGDSFELYNRIYKYTTAGIEKAFVDLDKLALAGIKVFEKKAFDWDGAHLWYSTDASFNIYKIGFLPPAVLLSVTRLGNGKQRSFRHQLRRDLFGFL